MDVYYGGNEDYVVSSEEEAIEYGMKAGIEYLEAYNDGWINYSNTIPTKQAAIERFTFLYQSYVAQYPHTSEETVLATEEKLEEYIDVEWQGKQLTLPIPLIGVLDKEVERKDGKFVIVDYKSCYNYSNPDKIDGKKILQAIFYYLLAYAKTGKEPYSMVFQEAKYTKNRDGSKQVREYEMVYAENEQYFDLFFRFYDDITRALNGEQVYVPNLDALFDNEVALVAYIHRLDVTEETARLMKKHKVENLTDLLQKQITKASSMRKLLKTVEQNFIQTKSIDYSKMKNEEKIQTKLLEHGMVLHYDSVVSGATVDLYRFSPSLGLKLSKLDGYTADVEQVLGVSGVRVLAPIPNSTLVGFEVPKKHRTYPKPPNAAGYELAIGQDIMGEPYRFDIRQAPHMLVAGASGSGKSVFLNAILGQLTKLPDARLYLYDPKKVELIAHAKAKNVAEYADDIVDIRDGLHDLVGTMNARYELMKKAGKRTIDGTGEPYIFVVIDEYGDLVMQNYTYEETQDTGEIYTRGPRAGEVKTETKTHHVSKDIARDILLLAQKARAAGIHIIMSTQRPSVNVVTGTIKANFVTKACFRTAKAVDSFVVLDDEAAAKLLGKGDMIFTSDEGTVRLQGYTVD